MFRWMMVFSLLSIISAQNSYSCTGIVQKADNGDWVYARTMEFDTNFMNFDLLFVPRGIDYTSKISNTESGAQWKTKYAHVGFNPFSMQVLADGLNEKGLAAGGFYFPGFAKYEDIPSADKANAVSNIDFVSWVLGNFATVKDVKEALKKTKVVGVVYKEWSTVPPIHYIVVDKTGDRIVIEYIDGKQTIYDAWIGTITNAPSYAWHEQNVRNYIGLTALNRSPVKIEGKELTPFGQGSGAIGLPGDFTPPSRFVRATFLNQAVLPGKDALAQVERAFKILNQFDIPKGAMKQVDNAGKVQYKETQWTSASDLSNQKYYFHTYTNRVIRLVDLNKLDLNGKSVKILEIPEPEAVLDITAKFDQVKK